jgi:hypothetical protein
VEVDDEVAKFKWMLGAGLMFLISGCFSVSELRYAVSGTTTDAQLLEVKEVVSRGRWGRRHTNLQVHYQFNDGAGGSRSEADTVSTDWPFASEDTISVQYIPGKAEWSRIAGNRRDWAVIVFGLSLCGVAYLGFQLYQAVNNPIARTPRGRRSR